MPAENFIFIDFFAVKVDGSDVNPGICLLLYKRVMYLRISVYFHQIVPIWFRLEGYNFSMSITACFHYNTYSWVDVTSVNFNSKKSPRRWRFRPTSYIIIFPRRIQRLQIYKIPTGLTGTLIHFLLKQLYSPVLFTDRLLK